MKAYDLLVQCESGLASVTGLPDGPGRVGVSICDIACGMYAHAAVLTALIERGQTGVGQGLAVSLFDALADWMSVPLLHYDYAGITPERIGLNHPSIAPYGAYTCKDGSQVVIAVQNNREWQRFCAHVLQKPDMSEDARFDSNVNRCNNREPMDAEINAVVASLDGAAIKMRLDEGQIAFAAVNSVAELSQHPQLRRTKVRTANGAIDIVSPPAVSTTQQIELGAVPALGEHTEAVRDEFSRAAN
jgi:crotonobetainyl-CoA:carnitine CoA-transferase CaiB-like acyl-CoA transferase